MTKQLRKIRQGGGQAAQAGTQELVQPPASTAVMPARAGCMTEPANQISHQQSPQPGRKNRQASAALTTPKKQLRKKRKVGRAASQSKQAPRSWCSHQPAQQSGLPVPASWLPDEAIQAVTSSHPSQAAGAGRPVWHYYQYPKL